MTEIVDGVVNRRRGEEEDMFLATTDLMQIFLQSTITRSLFLAFTFYSGVSKMVGLVDQNHFGIAQRAADVARPLSLSLQIRVIVRDEVNKTAVEIRQVLLDHALPHVFERRFRRKKNHVSSFVKNKPLDQHQADERLPESNPVA